MVEGRPQLLSTSPDGIVVIGIVGFSHVGSAAIDSTTVTHGVDSTTVTHGVDVRHRHLRIQLGPLTRARRVQAERAGGTIVT